MYTKVRGHGIELTVAEVMGILDSPGWIINGGRESAGQVGSSPTEEMLLGSEVIQIHPWDIEVRRMYPYREQRKKMDGGGFHNVMKPGVALRLKNLELESQMIAATRLKAKEREAKEQRKAAEELEARRIELISSLNARFAGKKLLIVVGEEYGIRLEFEDGSALSVRLDGGDLFDAFINVDGVQIPGYCKNEPYI